MTAWRTGTDNREAANLPMQVGGFYGFVVYIFISTALGDSR
jgi:hypothetical protein